MRLNVLVIRSSRQPNKRALDVNNLQAEAPRCPMAAQTFFLLYCFTRHRKGRRKQHVKPFYKRRVGQDRIPERYVE